MELGRMLDEYDAVRAAAERSRRQAQADDVLFLQRFSELRRSVLRPAFEGGGVVLNERGHGFRISEAEYALDPSGKSTEASIAFHIVPGDLAPAPQADDRTRSLTVTTRHYNRSVSVIGGEYAAAGGLAGSKGSYDLERITPELIEGELLKLVARIFKA